MRTNGGTPGAKNTARNPDPSVSRSAVRAWLRLLRAPNLATVPGDPLAGFLLATGGLAWPDARFVLVLAAALLLYAAGLVMNDLVDLREDREDRPSRPLPAGQIDIGVARTVVVACILGALLLAKLAGLAPMATAGALLVAVFGYNVALKTTPLGPLAMGLCRGISVLLGASLVDPFHPLALTAAGGITAYVAMLTFAARVEIDTRNTPRRAWLPALVVLALAAMFVRCAPVDGQSIQRLAGAFFLAFTLAGLAAWRWNAAARIAGPAAIGLMVSALIPLQSAMCLAAGETPVALLCGMVLLFLWPLNRMLAASAAPD